MFVKKSSFFLFLLFIRKNWIITFILVAIPTSFVGISLQEQTG